MATVTIDNKEYNLDDLSDESKRLLSSIQFAQAEIQRLQGQIAIMKTAASTYSSQLNQTLSN